jgi:pSer/pThr/pTyr-binding forkhead associated (FHA) protein
MPSRIEWKNQDGEEHVLTLSNAEVTFGRNTDSDIFVPNRYVSRQHAKVVPTRMEIC